MVMPDKSRYVYLYLPSTEDKARWEALAKEAGVPLSKFIIEVVESSLAEDSTFKPRGELMKEIGRLRSENRLIRDDLNQKKIVLEKYENDLKKYRSQVFMEERFEGVRKYSKQIIEILKRGVTVDSYKLLEELGIDPKDSDLVTAVSRQLEDLEGFGFITNTSRGWRWTG